LALFGFGTAIVLFTLQLTRKRRLLWLAVAEAEPFDAARPVQSRLRTTLRATYPSTIGLTVLIALALWPQPGLAALLAGILAGLGGGALEFALQLAAWERRRGARVIAEPGRRGRVFEAPR